MCNNQIIRFFLLQLSLTFVSLSNGNKTESILISNQVPNQVNGSNLLKPVLMKIVDVERSISVFLDGPCWIKSLSEKLWPRKDTSPNYLGETSKCSDTDNSNATTRTPYFNLNFDLAKPISKASPVFNKDPTWNVLTFLRENSAMKDTPITVSIGCFMEVDIFSNKSIDSKEFLELCDFLNSQGNLTAILSIKTGKVKENNISRLNQQAKDKLLAYLKTFSTTSLMFLLDTKNEENSDEVYCNTSENVPNGVLEKEILDFAATRNISVIFKSASNIENLNPHIAPDNIFDAIISPKCIPWTSSISKSGISLNRNNSGITLYIEQCSFNIPLSPKELEVMFLFTFHKFSLIEIIPATYFDLILAIDVLSRPVFHEILQKSSTEGFKPGGKPSIYLQIDCDFYSGNKNAKMSNALVLSKLSKLANKLAGVQYCSNWLKGDSIHGDKEFFQSLVKNGGKIGLLLENCLEEAKTGFKLLTTSGNASSESIHSEIKYFLCNLRVPVRATNSDKVEMTRFLQSVLQVKKYYAIMFPNSSKEFFFRINPVPVSYDSDGTLNYLKFLADVDKYAEGYQLRFFLSSAFDSEDGRRYGWWKIENFDDLTETSVFVEKQAQELGMPTWTPVVEPDPLPNSTGVSPLVLILNGVFLSVLLLAVVIGFIWYKRKFAFLSREEVLEFRKGTAAKKNANRNAADISADVDTVENLRFPKEFEIPKRRFLLVNIIGRGNFGLVYNAQLTLDEEKGSSQAVAVKMPLPGCSKVSFKSMLVELKVLCYVGSHPNVIKFIGANTKKISKGKVYIATEMCEMGALQNYLRSLQRLSRVDGNDGIDKIQLNRFAHEVSLGMKYLGERKVIHGDLSTRNILLDSNLTCKIGDFGLSRRLYEYQKYVKQSQEPLPWRWMALESLKKMEFTAKSDVWSYGVTLWEIYSLGGAPYPGLAWTLEFADLLEKGLRLTSPDWASQEIYETMMTCWRNNPVERPDFTELADFFQGLRDKEYVSINENPL